ncbi:universal stress protein [uncultured Tateyamaria sp.]|uniref:universal stress protein n=1 Tax=Tateyamaria sp. TaxID=1929288 RepID=UPI00261336C3|nr:universal stress protein [uncultured Tateyamaria sp.]
MYSNILVPMALDHDISPQTLAVARALGAPGATITALHVHEEMQGSARAYVEQSAVQAGVDRAQALLADKVAGLEGVTPVLVQGHSARAIIDYAAAHGIDCIVVGSHKPGLSDYFLGSTAARVVRHAGCAVHVHRTSD